MSSRRTPYAAFLLSLARIAARGPTGGGIADTADRGQAAGFNQVQTAARKGARPSIPRPGGSPIRSPPLPRAGSTARVIRTTPVRGLPEMTSRLPHPCCEKCTPYLTNGYAAAGVPFRFPWKRRRATVGDRERYRRCELKIATSRSSLGREVLAIRRLIKARRCAR